MHITDKIYILISNKIAIKLQEKSILLNRQQSKPFTSIDPMYINTVIICRGDRLNLQNDMSFFTPQIQFFTEST